MHLKYITNCRICDNPVLSFVFSLGKHFLHGSFVNPTKNVYPPIRQIPVDLVRCNPEFNNGCGLLQLAHTVPPSVLYSNYNYRSSTNATMRGWLDHIVASVLAIKPYPQIVQDIGANDLYTLKRFPHHVKKIGIDGCDIVRQVDSEGIEIINGLYPDDVPLRLKNSIDIILSISCLYDINDINRFVRRIVSELSDDGLWVFEVAYLPTILKNVDYSYFCHEHLEAYSLATLEYLLNKHGLKIVKCSLTETNNGSILCYASHTSCVKFDNKEEKDNLQKIRLSEFDLELDTDKPYREFIHKAENHREQLFNLIKNIVEEKKQTVHLLAASTKGNVVLQFVCIDNNLIKYAADRSPEKVGCKTLGTDIEIISEEESRKMLL